MSSASAPPKGGGCGEVTIEPAAGFPLLKRTHISLQTVGNQVPGCRRTLIFLVDVEATRGDLLYKQLCSQVPGLAPSPNTQLELHMMYYGASQRAPSPYASKSPKSPWEVADKNGQVCPPTGNCTYTVRFAPVLLATNGGRVTTTAEGVAIVDNLEYEAGVLHSGQTPTLPEQTVDGFPSEAAFLQNDQGGIKAWLLARCLLCKMIAPKDRASVWGCRCKPAQSIPVVVGQPAIRHCKIFTVAAADRTTVVACALALPDDVAAGAVNALVNGQGAQLWYNLSSDCTSVLVAVRCGDKSALDAIDICKFIVGLHSKHSQAAFDAAFAKAAGLDDYHLLPANQLKGYVTLYSLEQANRRVLARCKPPVQPKDLQDSRARTLQSLSAVLTAGSAKFQKKFTSVREEVAKQAALILTNCEWRHATCEPDTAPFQAVVVAALTSQVTLQAGSTATYGAYFKHYMCTWQLQSKLIAAMHWSYTLLGWRAFMQNAAVDASELLHTLMPFWHADAVTYCNMADRHAPLDDFGCSTSVIVCETSNWKLRCEAFRARLKACADGFNALSKTASDIVDDPETAAFAEHVVMVDPSSYAFGAVPKYYSDMPAGQQEQRLQDVQSWLGLFRIKRKRDNVV